MLAIISLPVCLFTTEMGNLKEAVCHSVAVEHGVVCLTFLGQFHVVLRGI